jgi:hypothetical protein
MDDNLRALAVLVVLSAPFALFALVLCLEYQAMER